MLFVYFIREEEEYMIRKNDILVYAECLEEGDENCLMIALEDECTPAKVPMVKTRELNTNLACPPVNFFETKYYRVVGHATANDTPEALTKKYLPQNKWRYTDAH